MNLVLLGPPGAGKGTQSRRLSDNLKIPQISTGDLLRQARRDKTPLGLQAESYMTSGKLVPDDLVIAMIRERLKNGDCRNGCIFDGFPRTVGQAGALGQLLSENGMRVDRVVNFDVDREEVIKRLSGRRHCRQCGENYHLLFQPPQKEGVCDRCQGELLQRDDDREDVIRKRLEVYEKETAPLVAYYRNKGSFKDIKGTGSVDDIFSQTLQAIRGGS